jgi:hypothetical protein
VSTNVEVQHEPGVWIRAWVEKQWRFQGRWRLSVYYYVGVGLQHYRVYDADQCRAVNDRSISSPSDEHGIRP